MCVAPHGAHGALNSIIDSSTYLDEVGRCGYEHPTRGGTEAIEEVDALETEGEVAGCGEEGDGAADDLNERVDERPQLGVSRVLAEDVCPRGKAVHVPNMQWWCVEGVWRVC